jgi:hypothetical protein
MLSVGIVRLYPGGLIHGAKLRMRTAGQTYCQIARQLPVVSRTIAPPPPMLSWIPA